MMRSHSLRLLTLSILCTLSTTVLASGPRWVTGAPYYYPEGLPIVWYTSSPYYFTDAGDLSPYVNHAAADALVKAAASVWTVPTANFNLLYGGTLAEHVSLANVYLSGSGVVFPPDVQSTSYLTRQIAVIYDSDGSITDLLLGSGASSPSSCLQNAVTESVDSISTAGKIQHAILILNGRCTGPAPEQQLQLQYQLMRAFGRIIGLSWSQTNDNVFTGNPTPTLDQALHWPIMHPIDILCGPYSYQCLPDPFTLRDDDVSGLGLLYPVGSIAPSVPGKTDTLASANRIGGVITFPDGQGMQGVNVVIHRLQPSWNIPEAWEDTSAVSGYLFRRRSSTPIHQIASSPLTNMGSPTASLEGWYDIFRTPIPAGEPWQNLIISTQPINPLYTGAYAVGPYDTGAVAPSGSVMQQTRYVNAPYTQGRIDFNVTDAASACQPTPLATASAPATASPTGWWNGDLCSYGYSAWSSVSVKAARTLTIEVSALDENAAVTTTKTQPVIGVWSSTDAVGIMPTIASTSSAFNASVNGMTALSVHATQAQQLRIGIMDQRGDGRPDYAFQGRIFYADSVTPSTVPANGAPITITGMGFRPGNTVTINGIPATVSGWTSNTITAVAPSLHSNTAVTTDIVVHDLVTGSSTTMTGALSYRAPQPELTLLSAPSSEVVAQTTDPTPFAVKALAADGTTPLPGVSISLSSNSGQVRFEACGNTACTLSTDASGRVTTLVTPLASGTFALNAVSNIGSVTSTLTVIPRIQTVTALNPEIFLAQKAVLTWTPQVSLSDNGATTTGVAVQWSSPSGSVTFNPTQSLANQQSIAQTTATAGPFAGSSQTTASACAWSTICGTFTINSISDGALRLSIVSGAAQSISPSATFAPVILQVSDPDGHPVAGASVTIYQTVEPWLPLCPPRGRCPIAPIYQSSSTTLISGLDGTIQVSPLEVPGTPERTHLAAATGASGFLTLNLRKHPLKERHPR